MERETLQVIFRDLGRGKVTPKRRGKRFPRGVADEPEEPPEVSGRLTRSAGNYFPSSRDLWQFPVNRRRETDIE